MRYNTDTTNRFELIVKDEDGQEVYRHEFGTDLSPALKAAKSFEDAHPGWEIRIWQRRITYQQGQSP